MGEQRTIYCVVPREAGPKVLALLRSHYAKHPHVRVISERRQGERRRRDPGPVELPVGVDRRSTDRRKRVVPRSLPPLPAHHPVLGGVEVQSFQRLVPVGPGLEGLDTDGVIAAVRGGDPSAVTELCWRYYDRMASRLSVVIGDPVRVDGAVISAFGRILDVLEADELKGPFEDALMAEVDRTGAVLLKPVTERRAGGTRFSHSDPRIDEPVVVRERDPMWSSRARAERDRLRRTLKDTGVLEIEHVGSTAVPGIGGRPVVDLVIGMEEMRGLGPLEHRMMAAGYEALGAAGVPGRLFFRKRRVGRFDVHVVEHKGDLWTEMIALREYLRRRPAEANRWTTARRQAARSAPTSLLRYAELRAPALEALLERALLAHA